MLLLVSGCTLDLVCLLDGLDARRGPARAPRLMANFSVGMVSRMRVSSATAPFSSGTLKSTRMKTRLPVRSRSRMESLVIVSVAIL